MKTKGLFGILLLFLCAINLVSCDDEDLHDKVTQVKMFVSGEKGMYQPLGAPAPIDCMLVKEEGEDEYRPLGFSGIAGFEYEKGYMYELLLKKTVLANPPADGSNVTYELIEVLSKKMLGSLHAVEVVYKVDAEQKELIETDLQNNLPVPVGGGYILVSNHVSIVDANKKILSEGTFQYERGYTMESIPESYKLVWPDAQIDSLMQWMFDFNGKKHSYDVFLVKWGAQRYTTLRPWLYEDLTEYYQTKFPDAGVRGVVRVQILSYKPSGNF